MIKRYNFWSVLMLCLALSLHSCNQDEAVGDAWETTPEQLTPIRVFTNVTGVLTRTGEAADPNIATSEMLKEKGFYLYIDQAGEDLDYFVQMKYNTDKQSWNAYAGDALLETLWLKEKPGTETAPTVMALFVDGLTQSKEDFLNSEYVYTIPTGENLCPDILYAHTAVGDEVNKSVSFKIDGTLSLNFRHALARLQISLPDGETHNFIKVSELTKRFYLNKENGSFTPVVEENAAPLEYELDNLQDSGKNTAECWVVPQTAPFTVSMEMNVWTFNDDSDNLIVAGGFYKLPLTYPDSTSESGNNSNAE